jgi:hypothetical protein
VPAVLQEILKVGVGIVGDAQKLMRDFGLDARGLVDLSDEANVRLDAILVNRRWSLAGEWVPPPPPSPPCDSRCAYNAVLRPPCSQGSAS